MTSTDVDYVLTAVSEVVAAGGYYSVSTSLGLNRKSSRADVIKMFLDRTVTRLLIKPLQMRVEQLEAERTASATSVVPGVPGAGGADPGAPAKEAGGFLEVEGVPALSASGGQCVPDGWHDGQLSVGAADEQPGGPNEGSPGEDDWGADFTRMVVEEEDDASVVFAAAAAGPMEGCSTSVSLELSRVRGASDAVQASVAALEQCAHEVSFHPQDPSTHVSSLSLSFLFLGSPLLGGCTEGIARLCRCRYCFGFNPSFRCSARKDGGRTGFEKLDGIEGLARPKLRPYGPPHVPAERLYL